MAFIPLLLELVFYLLPYAGKKKEKKKEKRKRGKIKGCVAFSLFRVDSVGLVPVAIYCRNKK